MYICTVYCSVYTQVESAILEHCTHTAAPPQPGLNHVDIYVEPISPHTERGERLKRVEGYNVLIYWPSRKWRNKRRVCVEMKWQEWKRSGQGKEYGLQYSWECGGPKNKKAKKPMEYFWQKRKRRKELMHVEIRQKAKCTEAEYRLYLYRSSVLFIYRKRKYRFRSRAGRLPQLEEVSWIRTTILLENCWVCIPNNWLKLRHIIPFFKVYNDFTYEIFQTDIFVITL